MVWPKKKHPKNELLCLCEAWLCHILDKLLCLRFFRYKLERTNSHKVTSCLFLENKLFPNLVVWNKHFICSWMYVFWAQLGGSLASLTWGPLPWLKITWALTRSWMVSTDFSPMSGGWWWLLADLESSVAGNFFNIEARFQKQKERGRSSICSVCFISCWLKQGRWPNPESLWEGRCQALDSGRHG